MAPATSPATPTIKISLCAAFAAATPTTKLAVEMIPSLAPVPRRAASQCDRRSDSQDGGEDDSSDIPPVRSQAPHENQYDEDDQDDTDDTDSAVAESVAVAAEAATEPTKQKDDENDDEYKPKRHDLTSIAL